MKQPVLSQKTTSQTIHSDGTKTSTTVVVETIPETSEKIETTTVVKEFTTQKECDRSTSQGDVGQILVEEVTETTVTKKRTYYKEKQPEECTEIDVGWGGMLCGDNPVAREEETDQDDDLTMDTALRLDTFGGKTVNSNSSRAVNSNASQDSNNKAIKKADSSNEGRKSALSLFTSPSAFFRKTHPSVNEEASETDNKATGAQGYSSQATPIIQESQAKTASAASQERPVRDVRKKTISLDDEILNIVKKDAIKSSTAVSRQLEQSHIPKQSRQTALSKCIDVEERQECEPKQCIMTGSSPVPISNQGLSRGVATPSPTPKVAATKSTVSSSGLSSRQSHENVLSPMSAMTKTPSSRSSSKPRKREAVKSIVPKHKQTLLTTDSDFASPKIALSRTTAAVTDDKFLHFFSYQPPAVSLSQCESIPKSLSPKWRKSTSVSIENTYCMNVVIHNNTAVVGVPYDRNIKGLLTGAAYIFEREENKDIWTQVKKIVPKDAPEFATVGYSVGVHNDIIVVSVPHVGSTHASGGCVRVYRRVQKYKWSDKGALVPPTTIEWSNAGIAGVGKKDVQITTVNKTKKGASSKKKFGTRVAVQGNVVVVSDHYDHEDTCIYVYEYDDFSLKWVCIQDNLLSEAQKRHFGSRLALTNDGNGILIGCHAKMRPTEILYYSRYGRGGKFHLQQVIVVSKRSSSYGVGRGAVGKNGVTEDITDFKVDGKNLMIGTASSVGQQNQHSVHIYQLQDNDTWILMSKVDDPSVPGFGLCVGIAGNRAMITSRGNAFSYNLDGLISKTKRKQFMSVANIAEERRKKQPRPQVKYIDPEYLELPYVGSDLNEFRTRQKIALHSQNFRCPPTNCNQNNDGDTSSRYSSNSPSKMALSMARSNKRTLISRMRSPSPILRRMKGSSPKKRNISAPPLRHSST